jgi:hypothetical protein
MAPRQCTPVTLSRAALGALAAAFLILGCAPEPVDPGKPGSGGSSSATGGAPGSSGGAPGSGGASSGGAPGSGGASSGGASSGGATGSGGRGSGGATGSGGSTGSGGRGTGGSGTGTGGAATGTGGRGTGGGASGTGGGSGGGSTGTFAAAAAIFGTSCGTGMCHQGGAHVDLRNTAGLRDRIVSKMVSGTNSMASCQTKTYIVPNNPAMSVISQIIKAAVTGCGARMPDDCSTSSANPRRCLTTEQIATIDAWINAGAPP